MKSADIFVIAVLALMFLAYSWVTFTSPIAFGDEGYYSSMGKWIAENFVYPVYAPLWGTDVLLYPTIRLPMGHVISSSFYLFGGEAGIKLMMPFFAFLSALLIFVLFRSLGKVFLGAISSFVFILLPATVKYGVLNYPENQMLLFITASACFFFFSRIKKDKRWLIASGIMAGLAALSDPVGATFLGAYIIFILYERKAWKEVLIIIFTAMLIFSPWLIRNLILYDSPCYMFIKGEKCSPKMLIDVETYGFKKQFSRPEISTGAGLFKFGIIQFIRFGFGVTGLLAILGAVFAFERIRDWRYAFFFIWMAVLIADIIYLVRGNPRTEDLLRYSLFALPSIAFLIGVFFEEIIKRIKGVTNYWIWLSIGLASFAIFLFIELYIVSYIIAFLLALLLFVLNASKNNLKRATLLFAFVILLSGIIFYGILEVKNMQRVKQFSPGFIEACEWIKKNTPENVTIAAVYSHPVEYNCYRKAVAIQNLPDGNLIRLWANDTSYEHLKKWKIDYVLIEGFTIVPDSSFHPESEPMNFVRYLENSENFEKVYDNTWKYGFRGGVRIFKVK